MREHPQVHPRLWGTHPMVEHPQEPLLVRPLCPIQPNRICLCLISLMLIHLKVGTPNSNPRHITPKDNSLQHMGGMDSNPTTPHPHRGVNRLNIILHKIQANSLNGDKICDEFDFLFFLFFNGFLFFLMFYLLMQDII